MSDWKSLHIFYFDPDKDGLFLDGMLGSLERLQGEGRLGGWFCQRHWLHGPHLRVNVRLVAPAFESAVREALEQAAQAYLGQHPSTMSLSEEEYLRRYEPIAALELQEQHPLPLFANNSVQWQELALTEYKFGGPEGVRIARDFLAETQGILTEVMRRSRGSMPERLFLLLRLMMAYCASYEEPALAALSFDSHADAYLYGLPNGPQLRERFTVSFEQQAAVLLAALREVVEGTQDPLLVPWMDAVRRGYAAAWAAAREGHLNLPKRQDYKVYESTHLPADVRPASQGLLFELSPVHKPLLAEDSEQGALLDTPEFKGRRLMVNLVYDKFQSTGIRPLERLYLCSIITQTIKRAYGSQGWPRAAAPVRPDPEAPEPHVPS